MKPLTKKQQEVLDFIKLYIEELQFSPSMTDIKTHMGYKSENAVRDCLGALKTKGYINTTPNVARSIVVLTENNGWISVDDRLPELCGSTDYDMHVVCLLDSGERQICYMSKDEVWESYEVNRSKTDVTHWIPTPPSI